MQHRLKERAKEINDLLMKRAYVYVCGDAANMAREVHAALIQIVAEQREVPVAKAEEVIKNMRSANQYQVRGPILPRGGCYYSMSSPASVANTANIFSLLQEDVWS